MAAKIEIDLHEALRQLAEFQLRATGVGRHLDSLSGNMKNTSSSAKSMAEGIDAYYTKLQGSLIAISKTTADEAQAIDNAFVSIRAAAKKNFEGVAQANLKANLAASAYVGQLNDVRRVLENTANNSTYVKYMEKIATLQTEMNGQNKLLTATIDILGTAEGKRNAELKTTLASTQKMAAAETKQVQTSKELAQQLELLNTATGQNNSVTKARISAATRQQQEDTNQLAKLAELRRAYESLSGGIAAQIAQQTAMNNALAQAATFHEREQAQLQELQRRYESLNGGVAEQTAQLKVLNRAREAEVTSLTREIAALEAARAKQASLNGGYAEQLVRLNEHNRVRTEQIKNEEKYTAALDQVSSAEARLRAQDEARLNTMQAKNAATLAAARAETTLTEADARNIATAEKLNAQTKTRNDALVEQARVTMGTSKAQQELNTVRNREQELLAKLQSQHALLTTEYGRELAAIRAKIAAQTELNRLSTMSVSQLLGLTDSHKRHADMMNMGSQTAASLRAALGGLNATFGMYTSGTIVAAGATYAMFSAMRSAVTLGAEFTASMATANAVMNSNNPSWLTDSAKSLETQVRALGQTTVFTASEVAQGLIDLGQAGLSSADAILALRPALDLAQIGNLSMSESADIATNVMMIFGKQASDLTNIVDIMATAAVDSNTDIKQLANALTYAGPAAQAAGISLEQTTAAIEVLSNAGIKSSRAGTALRKLFTSLLNPTKAGTAVLEKYNIATQNLDGSTRDLTGIVGDLSTALNAAGVTAAQRLTAIQNLVGLYATSPVAALVNNAEQMKTALYTLENNVTGAAERMRKKMSDTLKVDWKGTMSAYEELQLSVYDKFEAYLRLTSARITETLIGLTAPIKVVLNADKSSLSVQDMVNKANANGGSFGVSADKTSAVNSAGDKVDAKQLVASMDAVSQSQLTVITQLDIIVEKFKAWGEVAAIAVGGIASSKVLGAISGGLGNISTDSGKAADRLTELAKKANNQAKVMGMAAGINSQFNTTLSAMQFAGAGATRGVGMLTAALSTLVTWAGRAAAFLAVAGSIASMAVLIGTVGYAIYTAFSKDNEQAIIDHAKSVEEANNRYKDLVKGLDGVGAALEKQALREEAVTLAQKASEYKNRLAFLEETKNLYESIGKVVPKPVLIEIQTDKAQLALAEKQLADFNKRINSIGSTNEDISGASDKARTLVDAVVAQQAIVDKARLAADAAIEWTRDNKEQMYSAELAKLRQVQAALDAQNATIKQIGETAIGVNAQIDSALSASRAAADKAMVKELGAGQKFDLSSGQMQTLSKEIADMRAAAEVAAAQSAKDGVPVAVDPQIQLKLKQFSEAQLMNAKALVELNNQEAASQKDQNAAAVAGLDSSQKKVAYQQQVNDLTAELATLDGRVASGENQGVSRERRIEVVKELTTAKNGLASAEKSVESASNRATSAQAKFEDKLGDFIGKQDAATLAALGSAAAYASGSSALAEYQVQQKLSTEVLALENQKISVNVDERKKMEAAIRSAIAAKQEEDVQKSLFDMRLETKNTIEQTAATYKGEEALRAFNVEKQVQQVLAGKSEEIYNKEIDAVRRQAQVTSDAAKTLEKANRGVSLIEQYAPASKMAREYAKDVEAVNTALASGEYTAEEAKKALKGIGDAYADNQASLTIWGKLTKEALDRVDSAFADAWLNIGHGFKSFSASILDSFKRLLAELAHEAITKPIMISFTNALLGTNKSGGISDAISNLTSLGSAGSAASSSGMGGLVSMGKNLYSVYNAITGVGAQMATGYATGGLTGAASAGVGYYSTLLTNLVSTMSSGFTSLIGGNIAITGATMAGTAATTAALTGVTAEVALGAASTIGAEGITVAALQGAIAEGAASVGTSVGVAGATTAAASQGIAAQMASAVSSMAAMWPLAVIMGMYQSGKLYSAGVRPDGGAIRDAAGGTTLGKVAMAPSAAMADIWKVTDNVLAKVVGGKWAAILSGSTFAQAMTTKVAETLFGTSYKTKDMGIQVGVEGGQFDAQQYIKQKKKGGWLSGSSKTRYLTSELDQNTQDALGGQYNATVVGAMALFRKLNVTLNSSVLDGLNMAVTRISTQGKTSEAIQTELNAWFVTLGNSAVLAINNATNSGLEGYNFDTLTNFVNNLYTVNFSLGLLGIKMAEFSITGGHTVEAIIAVAGSLETLNTALNGYYAAFTSDTQKASDTLAATRSQFEQFGVVLPDTRDGLKDVVKALDITTAAGQAMLFAITNNATTAAAAYAILEQRQADYHTAFYSESENTALKIKETTAQIKELGVTLPSSREGFRKMVEGIDKTTVTGKAMYDTLMSVAGAAGTVFDALEATATAAATAADKGATDSFAALQRSVTAQQDALTTAYNAKTTSVNDMLTTATDGLSGLTSISTALQNALKSLYGTSTDVVKMLRVQAKETLNTALATVKSGGSIAGMTGLEDALSTLSTDSTDLYSTLQDYTREQSRTAGLVAGLDTANTKQMTSADATVKALKDQLTQDKKAYDDQMKAYTDMLSYAQGQLDALHSIDNTIKSMTDALGSMTEAVLAALRAAPDGTAKANTSQNNGIAVDSLYSGLFGRTADAGGKDFWTNQLNTGALEYSNAANVMAQSAAAKDKTSLIDNMYQKLFGRAADAEGAAFWANQLTTGATTYDNLAKTMAQSAGSVDQAAMATKAGKIPGFAGGGFHTGGARLVGENGPEIAVTGPEWILDAKQTQAIRQGGGMGGSSGSMDRMATALSALDSRLESIEANTRAGAQHGGKTVRILDRTTQGGEAMQTKAATV